MTSSNSYDTGSLSDKGNIEAILPLTRQQAAMLLFCGKPGVDDLGFLQVEFELVGDLDLVAWLEAWRELLKRHEAMRMTVQAPAGKPAMMVCLRRVEMPWRVEDLSRLAEPERSDSLEAARRREREHGLDLTVAPPMRMMVFRLAEQRHRVLWCCHHLLLDGWSASIVLRDALAFYDARKRGEPAPREAAASYRRYRQFLRERGEEKALEFWRAQLAGPPEPLLLCGNWTGRGRGNFATAALTLRSEDSVVLQEGCAVGKFTPGALIRGAWAALLGQLTGRSDVIFGAVVSGRGAAFPGIESLVGMLANTVPVRIRLEGRESCALWLRRLHEEQLRAQDFEDIPLAEVLAAAAMGRAPFDHLLVIEKLPSEKRRGDGLLQIADYGSPVTSNYPFTLVVRPGREWNLTAIFDGGNFDEAWVGDLLAALSLFLLRMAQESSRTAGQLAEDLPNPSLPVPPASASTAGMSAGEEYRAPRTRLELDLVGLWQEILQKAPIGIHDNFFDLGGSSLLALKLMDAAETRFGRRLSPATLLQHATVALMASLLEEGKQAPSFKCLVPIQTGGDRPPLFCIHAGGGHVLFYRDLAQALGADYPVYGLQPVGMDGREHPLRSVEKMASRYLEEIRLVQPCGPYALAAHCFGSAVALEMAQQLRNSGEEVSHFFLLDAVSPILPAAWVVRPDRSMLWNFRETIRASDWRKLRWAVRFHTISKARAMLGPYQAKRLPSEAERSAASLKAIQHICYHALYAYRPKEYPGPVVLLRSNDNEAVRERELIDDWKLIAPNLEVERFSFDHYSFLVQPHVREVAEFIASRIDHPK